MAPQLERPPERQTDNHAIGAPFHTDTVSVLNKHTRRASMYNMVTRAMQALKSPLDGVPITLSFTPL